ncbi:MAG: MerR family transcriptional regulator [Treponema sp.]|nr:MerR family transcriptional regulator [Treponema sp.]
MGIKKEPQKTTKKTTQKKSPAKKSPVKKEPAKTECAAPKLSGNLVTIAELSKRTGVGIRMLRHHQQQGIIEPEVVSKGKESLYNFANCLAKLFAHYRDLVNNKSSGSRELNDEKLRQITAKRTLEEIKVQRIRGELHHTEDIQRIIGAMFSRTRSGFDSLPLGIAPSLVNMSDAVKIAEKIRIRKDKILHEITTFDFDTFMKTEASYVSQLITEDEEDAEQD